MSQHTITTNIIEQKLKCNHQACQELEKIEQYTFNIFNVQKHTNGKELEATVGYIFAKAGIFEDVPLNKFKFFQFIGKIASLYKDITYHNKTHAADLA